MSAVARMTHQQEGAAWLAAAAEPASRETSSADRTEPRRPCFAATSLDVRLGTEHLATLDGATRSELGFPHDFL
jgi:hypothetical protein